MIENDILRDYQKEILNKVRHAFKNHRKVMLQSPTGSGKSVLAAAIIEAAVSKGKKVLFLTERITLALQMAKHLENFGLPHNIFQGQNTKYDPDKSIHCGTIQTISRRLHPDFNLIIIDEAHVLFKEHIKLFEQYNNIPVLGLSATPWAKGLGKHFETLVVGTDISKLIEAGYLVNTEVYAPSAPDVSRIKIKCGEYDVKALSEASSTQVLVGDIVDHWLKLAERRKTICFAVDIAHSKMIVDNFIQAGVKAAHLDAYSDDHQRKITLAAFERGDIELLSSVEMLGRGLDIPNIECVLMARATKSLMTYIQQVGRGLRISDGKYDCLVLDHAGNTARHGFVTDQFPTELDDGTKNLDKKKKTKEEIEKLPKVCPSCKFVKVAHTCEKCGFTPERKSQIVEEKGELVKLKKKNKYEDLTKQQAYSQFLYIQQEMGYKHGWAAHKYREMFNVWPRLMLDIPTTPGVQIRNFITAQNIKNAYRKGKYANR